MTTLTDNATRGEPAADTRPTKASKYWRFDQWQRVEHALLLGSFTILVLTGLPQKFSSQLWANWMIMGMGGIETVRIIHRMAAVVLILETIYHFGALSYKLYVKRVSMTMLPSIQDAKDGIQMLGYNIGVVKTPARMGRYSFGEKVEYWAVIWGTVIMVLTGFILWNPIATSSMLPGQFIPAAKAAHGGEALLAMLSIITWHVYNVHLKQFNKSMFTGYISRHEMEEEHPLELEQIEKGQKAREPDPDAMRKRRRIFFPIAIVISAIMLISLYLFITYEQTAISTIPRQDIEVFVTATPDIAPTP